MDEYKISQAEIDTNNVKSAADLLRGDPKENKGVFDRLPELIAARFNSFVEKVIAAFTDVDEKETALAEILETKANADKVEEEITAIEEEIEAIKKTPGVATVRGSLTSKDEDGILRGASELTYAEIMELINDGKTVMLSVIDRTKDPARTYMAHYDGDLSAGFSSVMTDPVAIFFFYSGVSGLLQNFVVGKTGDITCTETFHYSVPKGTSEDEGKFLRCSDIGRPEWQTVESAEGVSF